MAGSARPLSLYKEMLRASENFTDYNFRTYFVRRVKEEFRRHSNIVSQEQLETYMAEAERTLGILRRQSALSHFYKGLRLPIE